MKINNPNKIFEDYNAKRKFIENLKIDFINNGYNYKEYYYCIFDNSIKTQLDNQVYNSTTIEVTEVIIKLKKDNFGNIIVEQYKS